MARVKATLLRRRFAALTRAMRSRKPGLGIYRSVERISSQALVQERTRATNDPIAARRPPRQCVVVFREDVPQTHSDQLGASSLHHVRWIATRSSNSCSTYGRRHARSGERSHASGATSASSHWADPSAKGASKRPSPPSRLRTASLTGYRIRYVAGPKGLVHPVRLAKFPLLTGYSITLIFQMCHGRSRLLMSSRNGGRP